MDDAKGIAMRSQMQHVKKDLDSAEVAMEEGLKRANAARTAHDIAVAKTAVVKIMAEVLDAAANLKAANADVISAEVRQSRALHAVESIGNKDATVLEIEKKADVALKEAETATARADALMREGHQNDERIVRAHSDALHSRASAHRVESIAAKLSSAIKISELETCKIELEAANKKALFANTCLNLAREKALLNEEMSAVVSERKYNACTVVTDANKATEAMLNILRTNSPVEDSESPHEKAASEKKFLEPCTFKVPFDPSQIVSDADKSPKEMLEMLSTSPPAGISEKYKVTHVTEVNPELEAIKKCIQIEANNASMEGLLDGKTVNSSLSTTGKERGAFVNDPPYTDKVSKYDGNRILLKKDGNLNAPSDTLKVQDNGKKRNAQVVRSKTKTLEQLHLVEGKRKALPAQVESSETADVSMIDKKLVLEDASDETNYCTDSSLSTSKSRARNIKQRVGYGPSVSDDGKTVTKRNPRSCPTSTSNVDSVSKNSAEFKVSAPLFTPEQPSLSKATTTDTLKQDVLPAKEQKPFSQTLTQKQCITKDRFQTDEPLRKTFNKQGDTSHHTDVNVSRDKSAATVVVEKQAGPAQDSDDSTSSSPKEKKRGVIPIKRGPYGEILEVSPKRKFGPYGEILDATSPKFTRGKQAIALKPPNGVEESHGKTGANMNVADGNHCGRNKNLVGDSRGGFIASNMKKSRPLENTTRITSFSALNDSRVKGGNNLDPISADRSAGRVCRRRSSNPFGSTVDRQSN